MVPGIEKLIVRVADMDRDEALKLLKGGVEGIREWNQRRRADEAIPHLLGADLLGADLSVANLSGADLGESQCGRTIFADVDLSEVRGLDPIKHLGPSTVGIDTLFRSHGKIPEAFLRGCGAPETLIAYLPSIMGAMQPIQFYSCFISYSSKDQSSPSVYTRTFKGRGSAASMLRRI
jgi:hypothetical protein